MKKQVVFIYDPRSNKLIRVADVKSLTTEAFLNFSEQANKNLKLQLEEEAQTKKEEELKFKKIIADLESEIDGLRSIIAHLLGFGELDEGQITTILYGEEEAQNDEN